MYFHFNAIINQTHLQAIGRSETCSSTLMALSSSLFHYCGLCIFVLIACFTSPIVSIGSHEKSQAALFVFGDSVFDPGNNNYINTITDFQANFRPYGESFFKHPTGRFSDGRLIPDFIAEYAKLPLIPSYFQIGKQHFVHGVNFASGGSGVLVETLRGFVIDLKTQLKHFKKVAKLLKKKVGATESKRIISSAVYILSTGNNDFLIPVLANSPIPYPEREYLQMIMGNLTSVLKGIYKKGGRKFVMFTAAPLGCVPIIRALNVQKGVKNGNCIEEEITNSAKMYNSALPKMLKQLEKQLPGFKFTIFNFFNVFAESIDNPTKYGFKTSKTACCGSGPFRGIFSCGGKRHVKEYELCKNVKDYLFFDSVHPTELAYEQYAELLWNGTTDVVAPYNLKSFFELST
ncbi:GDSL lipase-like isoform X1 [Nicotiana tabacum]|uniref:GDSL esterase/lipase 1-like isoform X1 n=1 Tax=Nicotiana tabacum TaxID=4097 RepID=A0A1S3ZCN0_TOBAC|nr:PREDICTED: GDSL esterase/lipase 1-like isoform X1 [Nicotiana tabacum]